MKQPSICTAPEEQDVAVIHHFLANESAWARNIPIEMVREAIKNSLNFGVFIGSAQVAYARVVSDCATFAYLSMCSCFRRTAATVTAGCSWRLS